MKKTLLYTCCLLLLLSSCSGTQEPAAGLLWKITTTDGREAFLFGTMHEYPSDQIAISDDAMAALETCSVLATELNLRDKEDQALFRKHNKFQTGAKTHQVLLNRYGASLKSMEGTLMQVADRHQIRITGLETAMEVLGVLEQIPLPVEGLTDEQILAQAERLIELYKGGEIDVVANEMLDKELGPDIRNLIVDQRNLNWLDDIENLIRHERAFIAVGMGHLGGEKGLISLLRQKGYRVEQFRN
ncbi:TraB/GumN family protein [Pontibacter amylolyticus]|uniref:GumN protein n=1 Tax=Pontibacter amylolyticus TaxID=1424080 RepID=A0ABQ1W940_9BACT|nr:TraB/GumN family protein [Pontibacter amylolyticus]GGG19862.1 GumN protein [Pontibacter amylolyticus]